jgi:hypothetical protein
MPFYNFPLLSPSHPLSIFLPISLAISISLCMAAEKNHSKRFKQFAARCLLKSSVADPDPSDPYFFGPSGSGSVSQRYGARYGSGSFYHQAKIVRKTLIPTVLFLIFHFLSLKNDVNVTSQSNKQKKFTVKSNRLLI